MTRNPSHDNKFFLLHEVSSGDENFLPVTKMEIAENGPEFVHADKLLSSAMEKYWKNKDGEDIRTYSNQSKVVEKQFKVRAKLREINPFFLIKMFNLFRQISYNALSNSALAPALAV